MSFDALTLSAVRDELEPLLVGSRLQKLVFLDELSLAVEAFVPGAGRTNVLLSAHAEHGRVQRIGRLPARGIERESPFSLLVRKHLHNAYVRSVRQPRLERVLELDCEQRDASGQHYRVLLIVEAMGRRGNLVLVDQDSAILDAARRSPPSRNPRRPVLPHLRYDPPPPQGRLLPEELTSEALAAGTQPGSLLAKYLAERIAGLSPLAGRELAFRATGSVEMPVAGTDWESVVQTALAFLAVVDSHQWDPTLAVDVDQRPVAFAAYRLRHLEAVGATLLSFSSISDALDAYYARLAAAGPASRGDPLAAERRALLAPIERAMAMIKRKIAALEHQLDTGHAQREPLRRAGELLLTHQASLAPGLAQVVLEDERIELDDELSAVENAQAYFARYRKAREAEERVPALLEAARRQAAHLADLRTLVELADQMDSIRALRREVAAATGGDLPKSGAKAVKSAPYRRIAIGDGWEVLLGTSAAGNAAVTFDLAQAEDVWLHARGVPGAHVILRTKGSTPPDEILERTAQLAAWHSAARTAGAVEVDVAPRRHVRKIPNAPPGLVRYSNERTLRVTPKA